MRVGRWLIVLPPRYWTRRPPPPMRRARGSLELDGQRVALLVYADQQEFERRGSTRVPTGVDRPGRHVRGSARLEAPLWRAFDAQRTSPLEYIHELVAGMVMTPVFPPWAGF